MSNWQQAYTELTEYVARTPEIEIDRSLIVIPGSVRPEFNRRFDAVTTAFLEDNFPAYLDEANTLVRHFRETTEEVKTTLGLDEIKLPASLQALINDPLTGLTRYILDPLFSLLKGATDLDGFERQSSQALTSAFQNVFRLGYEKWVLLSLVTLVVPDNAMSIPKYDLETTTHELEPDEKRGIYKAELPAPKETRELSFNRAGDEPAFVISDIIVHSNALERYVSFRTDLRDAAYSAKDISETREWQTIRQVGILYRPNIFSWPDIVVYADDRPQDIGLVADFSRFSRPDIIIESMEQAGWYQNEGLTKVNREYDFFRPRLGTIVVSRVAVPGEAMKELLSPTASETGAIPIDTPAARDIRIVVAGYDKSALQPVIDRLKDTRRTEPGP